MRHRHRVALLAACFAALTASTALAQGVGINGTGASADASAMLDVVSTTRGFLPPRMTAAQRAAIVSPATGLIVYQTDGTAGLYYNAGTPAAPSWQAAGGAGAGQWSTSGANLYYAAGKVGIGTTPVNNFGLTIIDPTNGLRVQTNTAGGSVASFGGVGTFGIDGPGVIGGRLQLLENGNLGLGNNAPTNPLSFANSIGKKISLWHEANGSDYGIGIDAGRLKLYSSNLGGDVALGYDNAGTFVEELAVKPTGAIAVGGNQGNAGEVLTSNGNGAAATWSSPSTVLQAASSGTAVLSSAGASATVPGLSLSLTLPVQGANVLVQYTVQATLSGCTICTGSSVGAFILIDGARMGYVVGPVGGASSLVPAGVNVQTLSGSQLLTGMSPGAHTIRIDAENSGAQQVTVGSLGAGYGSYTLIPSILIAQVIPN